jgi:acetyl-CoA synthetase (ADP-forming)
MSLSKGGIIISGAAELLKKAFGAKSVAIIGASRNPEKFGHWVVKALIDAGYSGKIYPINPHAEKILNIEAHPSLIDIPEEIDLTCIAVPAKIVPEAIVECGKKGVKVAIVFASGFGESGTEGKALEKNIVELARSVGLRIIGPNSLGIINTANNLIASFGRAIVNRMHLKGSIAFLSQSGAFGQALLVWAEDSGLGFSKFISSGNEADLDCADYLEYLAEDENTKVITLYMEGIRNGRKFLEQAKKTSILKPIIALKVGKTSAGSRAAASHTGALSGQDAIYDTAFKQAGIIRVRSPEEMFDLAKAFLMQPLPNGNKIGILTSSGGLGVETADACEELGLNIPVLPNDTIVQLKKLLPPFAGVSNPVDMTSQVHYNPEWFRTCIEILLKSESVDGIIIGISAFSSTEISEYILEATKGASKPVISTWIMGNSAREAIQALEKGGVPVYPTPERASFVMANLVRYSAWLRVNRKE